jgi:hypothetical protein
VFDKTVDKVVISLGTHDITKSKGDHDQVNINLTHAIYTPSKKVISRIL